MLATNREALGMHVVAAILAALWPGQLDCTSVLPDGDAEDTVKLSQLSADPGVCEKVLRIVDGLAQDPREEFGMIMKLLSTRLGTLLLTGRHCLSWRFPFVRPLAALPVATVERVLQGWSTSWISTLRNLARALKAICALALLYHRDSKGQNPIWKAIGYPGKRVSSKLSASAAAIEGGVRAATLNARTQLRSDSSLLQLRDLLQSRGMGVSAATDADRALCGELAGLTIDADVVVVGGGAGGGVAAAVLARGGLRVLVVEKGPFVPGGEFAEHDDDGIAAGYERAGVISTKDTGMTILAGSGLGGGTRINWCASFRTPPHVQEEWARDHGLSDFTSDRYARALDVVCARLGVHNNARCDRDSSATMLWRGLSANGDHVALIPQNCSTPESCVRHCSTGCASGGKQDTVRTFLADAVATGKAAILTTSCARRIVTAREAASAGDGARVKRSRRALGLIVCVPTTEPGRELTVFVRAPTVMCAAGSLHTPALLLRSGINGRGNVGKHLRLHPAMAIHGFYPSPLPSGPSWDGPMFTVHSRQNANWDKDHKYGPFLAVSSLLPPQTAALVPFGSGRQFQRDVLSLHRAVTVCMYTRDGGKGGRVTLGRDGEPVLHYHADERTQQSMVDGMCTLLKALRASGATRLLTPHQHFTCFDAPPASPEPDCELPQPDVEFEQWLDRVRRSGAHPMGLQTASAHQMGTARMGADPATSVVDPAGEMWDVGGVFVADASAFPTASGVNPMVTVEAMAYMTSERLAERLTGLQAGRADGQAYPTQCASFEW